MSRAAPARLLLPALLAGCLEQTTGESAELDPRILQQVLEAEGSDLQSDGPTVTLRGTVIAPEPGAIDVDITVKDAASPGGVKRLGKIPLDEPGAFELVVPADQSGLFLAFFQDLAADGPSADDPFALVELDVGAEDVEGVQVELVVGAYEGAQHAAAAPGAPGGGTPGLALPAAAPVIVPADQRPDLGLQPFGALGGVTVTVSGSVSGSVDAPIDLVVELSPEQGGAGTLVLAGPGPFRVQVPRGVGAVTVRALQDLAADGPDAVDPMVSQVVDIGELDIDGLVFELGDPPAGALVGPDTSGGAGADEGSAAAAPPHDDAATGAPEAVAHVEMPPGGVVDPTAGLTGPFDDHDGPTVIVAGTVLANDSQAVDLDLRVPDDEAEAGVRDLGKVLLTGPGEFAIRVPAALGDLRLEGFQDLEHDGPDGADPWGAALVEVGTEDVSGVRLMLVAGARGSGADHSEVAHVEASSGAETTVSLDDIDRPVDPSGVGPFANHRGKTVKLRGSVSSEDSTPVDIDLWIEDADAPGGMRNQGKIVLLGPDDFVIRVPRGAGRMALEAYQDTDVDGPTEADPFARVDLEVADADVTGVDLALALSGSRGGGGSSGGQAPPPGGEGRVPFADHSGPMVVLSGVVRGEHLAVVFIDLRVPDADAPGGMRQVGQIHLQGPGVFEVEVPKGLGRLELEAFQDGDHNGPDDDDPYGRLALEIAGRDLQAAVDLVDGGRALAAAAGAPGGGDQPTSAGPGEADPFPSYQGERVQISGRITWAGAGKVDVDLFKTDPTAPGGRTIAGKLKVAAGSYRFSAPKGFGDLELEAFVDVDGDGPSSGDPAGRYVGNPLLVGGDDIDGVDIVITGS